MNDLNKYKEKEDFDFSEFKKKSLSGVSIFYITCFIIGMILGLFL